MTKKSGATDLINSDKEDAVQAITSSTRDGVDVAIEAVGYPAGFEICRQIVRPGGDTANVGVHGKPVDLQLQKLWIRNIGLLTGP